MAIRREEVERIAELARLALPPERLEAVAGQLSRVLDFVARLETLDLGGDEPGTSAPDADALREDRVNGRRLGAELATRGAPAAEHGFFLVPPIVENVNP
ncbi:MAG: Asp-tRNA(Asn)/Glu-tRNA(Gln) amidotransferase subunit GatC [Candidatus Eisenbacteria bacterium]